MLFRSADRTLQDKEHHHRPNRLLGPPNTLHGLQWASLGVTQVPPPWGTRKVAPRQEHSWTRSMAGAASPKLEKPSSSQDGGPALQELGMRPTVTPPSSAAADGLLITEMATLAAPLLGAALLTALYTRMATTALASPCTAAPPSSAPTSSAAPRACPRGGSSPWRRQGTTACGSHPPSSSPR